MVRVAHISDSHLGSAVFQLAERKKDARACLKKAVDMALRKSPDILVHTGDLFDRPDPSNEDLSFVMELFRDIGDDVCKIVVQGNHDIPYGYRRQLSPILSIENAGLVRSTTTEDHASFTVDCDGEKVDINLISWTRPRRIRHLLTKQAGYSSNIKLLFAHDLPVDKQEIPASFDYIGIGHSHNFLLDEEYDIGRPGSTAIIDWKKEQGAHKKLIVAEITKEGNEYFTETLNDVRDFKFITGLDVTGMGPEEISALMKERIDHLSVKKNKKPIIIMEVKGAIDTETEQSIGRAEILEYGDKVCNPLFFHVEPRWDVLGARRITLSEPLNAEKSIVEYLEQTQEEDPEDLVGLYHDIVR